MGREYQLIPHWVARPLVCRPFPRRRGGGKPGGLDGALADGRCHPLQLHLGRHTGGTGRRRTRARARSPTESRHDVCLAVADSRGHGSQSGGWRWGGVGNNHPLPAPRRGTTSVEPCVRQRLRTLATIACTSPAAVRGGRRAAVPPQFTPGGRRRGFLVLPLPLLRVFLLG